ncbi:MAG: hypothetical protein ABI548_02755 [Polyangiaceae bacterium]
MTQNKASVKATLLLQAAALHAQAATVEALANTLPDEDGQTRKRYTAASNPVGENTFRRLCKQALETSAFTVYRGGRGAYECDAVEFDRWRDAQVHKPRAPRAAQDSSEEFDPIADALASGDLVRGAR